MPLRCRPDNASVAAAFAALLLLAACGGDRAEHELAVPWALGGRWLVADLHTHTRFSDGSLTVEELADQALANGCHALAITDHGQPRLKTATPEYFGDIRRLRERHKALVLFAGMEWNIPPYNGREHATVLLAPALEEKLLPEFRTRFDGAEGADAAEGLRWLQERLKDPGDGLVAYNHPSRNSESAEATLSEFLRWRTASRIMIGFEGAPGHQRDAVIGSYGRKLKPEHRWDPVAATVGGVWDTLLARGHDVWSALASSDYHNDRMDHPPCAYSRTYVQVPERSAAGVLRALRAGTYWAAHGRFLDHLLFTVAAPGLAVPASPGEVIRYRRGGKVRVNVAVERTEHAGTAALAAEVIGNCRSGRPEILATLALESDRQSVAVDIENLTPGEDKDSCYLRARIRRKGEGGDDWLAYVNPVRIRLR